MMEPFQSQKINTRAKEQNVAGPIVFCFGLLESKQGHHIPMILMPIALSFFQVAVPVLGVFSILTALQNSNFLASPNLRSQHDAAVKRTPTSFDIGDLLAIVVRYRHSVFQYQVTRICNVRAKSRVGNVSINGIRYTLRMANQDQLTQ